MTFVVFEGGEGVGKSTQVARCAEWARARGHEVVVTFEPGDTKAGGAIRDVLLHVDASFDARAELLLMLADRAQHVAEVIAPALARGAVVISDRFSPSTLAYQGVARGLGVAPVEELSAWAASGLEPDAVVVLDLPDAEAEARVSTERDRFERAGDAFHVQVRDAYRTLAAGRGWLIVDASGTADEVAARVQAVLAAIIP